MIFFRAARYLRYFLFSGHYNGHGIHSPFIFDLVSRFFRNKTDNDIVCKIECIRAKLKSDNRVLAVNDLGSGSEKTKNRLRSVSHIARYSPVPEKYGVLLSNLASEFGEPYMIEFGTSFGISTMYMAGSCPDSLVYTMEGSTAVAEIADANFNIAELKNIRLLEGSFDDLIPSIKKITGNPGLIFIDGNHRKDPLINYFNQMTEISDHSTVIIIDDIHYSREMEEAWEIIKLHEKVTSTIDIWRMGLVFFREGLTSFDYIIRY